MADVSIDSTGGSATSRGYRSFVWISAFVGYYFFVDADGAFKYRKTGDGGLTWGILVTIASPTTHVAFDVWYDQWTPGNTGTLIHCWYFDTTNSDVFYRSLDTASDTLGTQTVAFNGASATAVASSNVSGARMRGGNLYVAWNIDGGTEVGTARSIDVGANWVSRNSIMEAGTDFALLFPGGESDNQDAWAIYWDVSANAITLKTFDDSANSVSESSSINAMNLALADGTSQFPFSGSIRASDNHLIYVVTNAPDNAANDLLVFDINGASSIVAKTDIVTNIANVGYPTIQIDNSGVIRVVYNGKRDGTQTLGTNSMIYYVTSNDGGTTWSSGDTAVSVGSTNIRQTWTPLNGAKFISAWRTTANAISTNTDNSSPSLTAKPYAGLSVSSMGIHL